MDWQRVRARARTTLKFAGVGAFMAVVGSGLLILFVEVWGIIPSIANLLRMVFTTQFHFVLHRNFTWRGEHVTTLWQQWWGYMGTKVGTSALNWFGCFALTSWVGMHYLKAYIICIAGTGLLNLSVLGKVFKRRKTIISAASTSST